eukprot:2509125-Prymnesium_polylepis.2
MGRPLLSRLRLSALFGPLFGRASCSLSRSPHTPPNPSTHHQAAPHAQPLGAKERPITSAHVVSLIARVHECVNRPLPLIHVSHPAPSFAHDTCRPASVMPRSVLS